MSCDNIAPKPGRRRLRGAIDELPSGASRVRVYAGEDPPSPERTEPDPPSADEAAWLLNAAWSDRQ